MTFQQAGDTLQVVLDAVVHFAYQRLALQPRKRPANTVLTLSCGCA